MKTKLIILGGVGALGLYLYAKSKTQPLTPGTAGAPQGAASSSPSTLFSLFFPQAARADNNPKLNNQPYAQKAPAGGGSIGGSLLQQAGGVSGVASAIGTAWDHLFGSSGSANAAAADDYSLDEMDNAGQSNFSSSSSNSSEDFGDISFSTDSSDTFYASDLA